MDLYKFKFTVLQQEIVRFLCVKAGTSYNQRQLARALRVSPTAVSKSLPRLARSGLVALAKDAGRLSISLNRENPSVSSRKRVENLSMIFESGLAIFLFQEFPGAAIVLFGSYARGEDTMQSDVDIAVVGAEDKELDLERYESLLERRIHLSAYPSLEEIHGELRMNLCNGIVLSGAL